MRLYDAHCCRHTLPLRLIFHAGFFTPGCTFRHIFSPPHASYSAASSRHIDADFSASIFLRFHAARRHFSPCHTLMIIRRWLMLS
jgi:hypothetical protein